MCVACIDLFHYDVITYEGSQKCVLIRTPPYLHNMAISTQLESQLQHGETGPFLTNVWEQDCTGCVVCSCYCVYRLHSQLSTYLRCNTMYFIIIHCVHVLFFIHFVDLGNEVTALCLLCYLLPDSWSKPNHSRIIIFCDVSCNWTDGVHTCKVKLNHRTFVCRLQMISRA